MNIRDEEMVCFCSRVTAGTIRQAKQNGAVTLDDIRRDTGACTAGRCKELSPRGR
jgi:NAD(P)H-nitrite reductase large subunit